VSLARVGKGSERATLDPFEALVGDIRPRDQRDLMERPFFALAKTRRVKPILYKAGDTEVQVYAVPEHGMATIWDADVLIWAASQIVEAGDRGLATSRFFRFTPYQLLRAVGRATGQREYLLLKAAMARLQSTVVRTNICHGAHWRRQQFSWISEWEECLTHSGRCLGMEFVLPEWFYHGVIDRRLVLSIEAAYFALTGGIERWLYRVARKHAGRQPEGWRFDLRHLHAKSASQARFADFSLDIRRLVRRQALPGYTLHLEDGADGAALLKIRPRRAVPVDRLRTQPTGIGTWGASDHGISGAGISGHQAHACRLTHSPRKRNSIPNASNVESNSIAPEEAAAGGQPAGGAVPRDEGTP